MHPAVILVIAMAIVVLGILLLRLHAFLALLLAALTVAMLTPQHRLEAFAEKDLANSKITAKQAADFVDSTAAERVAKAFGSTCASIAIVIAMASIIGKCLLDSGAADRIVRSMLRWVGVGRAPLAFVSSGFLLAIPVFFDTVFYLMMPLGKAMRMRTGKNYLLYILSIVAGGTMAHSLVPPTPGPLIVVERLRVDLAMMIGGGCAVGLIAALAGYAFASWMNRRMEIPLRESPDISLAELEQTATRDDRELPPVWLAVTPILLPVLLIAGQTFVETAVKSPSPQSTWVQTLAAQQHWIDGLGNKNVALLLAAAVALVMLAWQKRTSRRELAVAVQAALASGGTIILITAAGGAFGAMMLQSGISEEIAALSQNIDPLWILPLAFIITTLIRTAQGSATVAMITAASVMQDFATDERLTFHPLYLALAIGCGSKPIAWMADSGFWIICKMSGMTEAEALKTVTPMSIVMGVAGLVATLIGAWLLPLV